MDLPSPAESAVELPSDAESEEVIEVDRGRSDTLLLPGESQCCDADCLARIMLIPDMQTKADEIRQAIKEEVDPDRRAELQFQVLRNLVPEPKSDDRHKLRQHRRFLFGDMAICRMAVKEILKMNKGNVTKWSQQQAANAETMWCWIHSFVAEPLPETVQRVKDFNIAINAKALLNMDPTSSAKASSLETRHLHPNVSLTELLLGNGRLVIKSVS